MELVGVARGGVGGSDGSGESKSGIMYVGGEWVITFECRHLDWVPYRM